MTSIYKPLIAKLLTEFVEKMRDCRSGEPNGCRSGDPDGSAEITHHLIIDHDHDQYMLIQTGWEAVRRICTPQLYIRLHEDKVWVERDETSASFVSQLVDAGVSRDDIVLAFHHPHIRRLTEFAVG